MAFSLSRALAPITAAVTGLLASPRLILAVGDDACVLTLCKGRRVLNAWIGSAKPEEGIADLADAFRAHRTVPVTLLTDTFEQIFREEKMPKVNILDRHKVVKRHLSLSFPGDAFSGSHPQGKDREGTRFYLLCSVPITGAMRGWADYLETLPNRVAGVAALPLESMSMLSVLAPRQGGGGVRWQILMTHNASGGLRHIITKQGRMVLTRLTPAPPAETEPAQAAALLEREIASTLSYVKRMGYTETDALDLVVLADPQVCHHLRARSWNAQTTVFASPADAAAKLGIRGAAGADQPYADALHAAWFAAKAKPLVRLANPKDAEREQWKQAYRLAPVAALLFTAYLGYDLAQTATAIIEVEEAIERRQQDLSQLKSQVAREAAVLETLPYRPDDVRGALALVAELNTNQLDFVASMSRVGRALADDGRVNKLAINNLHIDAEPQAQARQRRPGAARTQQAAAEPQSEITFTVELPETVTAPEDAVTTAEAIRLRLAGVFPGETVELTKPPVAVNADQVLRGRLALTDVAGGPALTDVTVQRYTAEYRVRRFPDAAAGAR